MKPIELVELQLKYYNAHDVEKFVDVFHEDVEIYVLGENEPYMVGRDAMRERYSTRFESPDLHASVTNRMVKGNVVIDYEEVTGIGPDMVIAIAIYEVEDEWIKKVRFVR